MAMIFGFESVQTPNPVETPNLGVSTDNNNQNAADDGDRCKIVEPPYRAALQKAINDNDV